MGNKLADFLSGTQVLAEVESPINGKLTVIRDIPWGTYIQGGGVTQSGGVAKTVWRTSLRKVASDKVDVQNALILGLGGGSIAGLIERFWPGADITGVDIDPVIVELGQKYLRMDSEVKIRITDAVEWVRKDKNKYDLICLDTYVGENFPKKLGGVEFLERVKGLMKKDGVLVVNRVYWDKWRKVADEYEKTLGKVFGSVVRVHPEVNVMFIVFNRLNRLSPRLRR